LVRRTSGNAHPAKDLLAGTETYGTASPNPQAATFSVAFETVVPGWNQFLLATGDCNHWMVMTKDAAIGTFVSNQKKEVLRSHDKNTPYEASVYRRQGKLEDPWIQYGASHSQATALYVENNYPANGGNGEGKKYHGLNVYVRNVEPVPEPVSTAWQDAIVLSDNGASRTKDIGAQAFDAKFKTCSVMQYKRNGAVYAIYKRITPIPSGWSAYALTNTWTSASNKVNEDFMLFGSESDMHAGTGAWAYCNYDDPGTGFPRDCGKSGRTQGKSFSHTQGLTLGASLQLWSGSDCPTDPPVGPPLQLMFASISAQQQLVNLVTLTEQATPAGESGWLKTALADTSAAIEADKLYTLSLLFGGGIVTVLLDGVAVLVNAVGMNVTKIGIRSSHAETVVDSFKAQGLEETTSGLKGRKLVMWKDASDGDHHAIATSLESEPQVSGRGDTSVVRLGKSSGLSVLSVEIEQPYTVFGEQRYVEGGAGRTFGSASSNWWCGLWGGQWSFFDTTVHVDLQNATARDGRWGLSTCRSDGRGNHNFYQDGVDQTRPRLRASEEKPGALAFGSNGFVKTEATSAEIGEVLVFSLELNPIERRDVETYLQNKTWPLM
jgi:hypothetical protein